MSIRQVPAGYVPLDVSNQNNVVQNINVNNPNPGRLIIGSKVLVVLSTSAAFIAASVECWNRSARHTGLEDNFTSSWLFWAGTVFMVNGVVVSPLIARARNMHRSTDRNLNDVVQFVFYTYGLALMAAASPGFLSSN